MRLSSLIILITTLLCNLLIWRYINKPFNMIEGNYPLHSLSLNPYKKDQSPFRHQDFTKESLEYDLKVLEGKTDSVRLYSSTGGLEQFPNLAKEYDINVIASAWISPDLESNRRELDGVIAVAQKNKNVTHVIIGNETQLHQTLPRDQLVEYLRVARKNLKTPVSTAEPWDFWINNPEMINEVDYIAIHILPYWNEIASDQAVPWVHEKYLAVKNSFPKKKIFIAETGWPSDGPQKGAAIATQANQAYFVRSFIGLAKKEKIAYNLVEAFDQPWKSSTEGRVGEHWGIMNADRKEKFPINGPVLEDPNWKYWAMSSTIVGFLALSFFLFRRNDLNKRGLVFSASIILGAVATATQLARVVSDQYMSPTDILFWTVMIALQVLLAIIMLTDAVEIADVVGKRPLKNQYLPYDKSDFNYVPFVSIHLACCNEPPDLVIETINSLAALDYPNYEVIVVDNNTPSEDIWKPVQAHCEKLGERFRFFSLGKWPGFKAGALNFAIAQTDPRTDVIGVVDADYVLERNWLKSTVPYFEDPKVGVVQAPQEHRQWNQSLFHKMENDEYTGFFRIGMVQRNEHNAIIQHGTMTLIRADILKQLKWAEWCICEDAELGLRILSEGKKAIYIDHSFGRGLVPNTYESYAKQRFRWAFGAMQILRNHWRELLGLRGQLNRAQRYQFVKGWLPWIGDGMHMIFSFTAIIWSIVLTLDPLHTDFPEAIFIYPALGLVLLRFAGTLWTYTARVNIGKKRTLLAMISGGSLTHKIAKAVLQGMTGKKMPFYRTPKIETKAPVIKSLLSVREELFLAVTLISFAFIIIKIFGWINLQARLWAISLLVQGIPYYAAIIASLVSSVGSKIVNKQVVTTVSVLFLLILNSCYHPHPVKEIFNHSEFEDRVLLLALDGVDFGMIDELKKQGGFKFFHNPIPLISAFPSITTLGFTGLFKPLGAKKVPGYEMKFYSFEDNGIMGGKLSQVYKIAFDFKTFFDYYRHKVEEKGFMYAFPIAAGKQDLARTEKLLYQSDKRIILSYVGGTDGANHMLGRARTMEFLKYLDTYLTHMKQVYESARGEHLKIVLFADHGFMHHKPEDIPNDDLDETLRKHSFNITYHLKNLWDVVSAKFGMLSSAILFVDVSQRENLANVVRTIPGVDLVFWQLDQHKFIYVMNAKGEKAAIEYDGLKRMRYFTITGDPLRYQYLLQEKKIKLGRWLSEKQWFDLTYENEYPDVPYRVYEGFFSLVENPASLILSLDKNYQIGSDMAKAGAFLHLGHQGTHGGLFKEVTWAFTMSTENDFDTVKALRYDQLMPLLFPKAPFIKTGVLH